MCGLSSTQFNVYCYLVRVHQLEEQVRELEIHNRTTAAEEQKKHRDVMVR